MIYMLKSNDIVHSVVVSNGCNVLILNPYRLVNRAEPRYEKLQKKNIVISYSTATIISSEPHIS